MDKTLLPIQQSINPVSICQEKFGWPYIACEPAMEGVITWCININYILPLPEATECPIHAIKGTPNDFHSSNRIIVDWMQNLGINL